MRTLFVLALTILFHTNVHADDTEAHVFVRRPMVVLVRQFQLPQLCGTKRDVAACTATVGQVLSCSCEKENDGWFIEARAQFVPIMYVLGPERVLHERDHIADLDRAVTEYVAALERVRFQSREECQLRSRAAVAAFPMTMNRFKDESNAARHPGYVRVTRPGTAPN